MWSTWLSLSVFQSYITYGVGLGHTEQMLAFRVSCYTSVWTQLVLNLRNVGSLPCLLTDVNVI